jgi:hypothetical protein
VPYRNGIIEAIGNTPLIKLKRASEETGCTILGKAEFMNPGQSVKDRAALFIIRDALNSGRLQPGGTVVEGTAGNTGIGLALVGNALGLKTVIVIPETQSDEKKDMLRLTGAKLIEVPAVPYKDPNNYVKYSGRLAEELAASEPNGAIWANQFDNVANRQGHIETTAQEIWHDLDGKVDGFICAVGTGQPQHVDLLAALRLRNDDDGAIAPRIADERETDAGVAGRALDHRAARLQAPRIQRITNDEERRAVLHRLAGIHELGLAEDRAAGLLGRALELDQRGVADRLDDAVADGHWGPLRLSLFDGKLMSGRDASKTRKFQGKQPDGKMIPVRSRGEVWT